MFGSLGTIGPLLSALGAFLNSVDFGSLTGDSGSASGSLDGLSSE